jgi:hypothetical protein
VNRKNVRKLLTMSRPGMKKMEFRRCVFFMTTLFKKVWKGDYCLSDGTCGSRLEFVGIESRISKKGCFLPIFRNRSSGCQWLAAWTRRNARAARRRERDIGSRAGIRCASSETRMCRASRRRIRVRTLVHALASWPDTVEQRPEASSGRSPLVERVSGRKPPR